MRNRKRISIRARDVYPLSLVRDGGFRPCPQRGVVERVADRPRVKASGALLVFVIFTRRCAGIAASPRRPLRRGSTTDRLLRNKSGRGHPSGLATRSTSLSFFPFDRSRGLIARVALLCVSQSGDGIEPASSTRLFQFLRKRGMGLLLFEQIFVGVC